jgi:transcriptional regulator with XRE-family HTH domain
MNIGGKIKELRKVQKITQKDFAKKVGIPYMTMVKIEQGVSDNPTIKNLKAIADALNISLDELVKNNDS